jgi:hypothetical protein
MSLTPPPLRSGSVPASTSATAAGGERGRSPHTPQPRGTRSQLASRGFTSRGNPNKIVRLTCQSPNGRSAGRGRREAKKAGNELRARAVTGTDNRVIGAAVGFRDRRSRGAGRGSAARLWMAPPLPWVSGRECREQARRAPVAVDEGMDEPTEIGVSASSQASYGRGIALRAGEPCSRPRPSTPFLSADVVPSTGHARRAVQAKAAFNASPPYKDVTIGRRYSSVLAALHIGSALVGTEAAHARGIRARAIGAGQALDALAVVHVAVGEHRVRRTLRVRRAPGAARVIDARGPGRGAVRVDVARYAKVVAQITDLRRHAVAIREALNALLRRWIANLEEGIAHAIGVAQAAGAGARLRIADGIDSAAARVSGVWMARRLARMTDWITNVAGGAVGGRPALLAAPLHTDFALRGRRAVRVAQALDASELWVAELTLETTEGSVGARVAQGGVWLAGICGRPTRGSTARAARCPAGRSAA